MKPRLLFVLSMAVFGTIGLFVRLLPLSSGEIALYRALLAAVTLSVYLKISGRPLRFKDIRAGLPLLLLSGAAMAFNWLLLFEAYRHTTVSIATLCYYMAALIVTVVSPALFKEKSSAFQFLCFLMSLAGLALIIRADAGAGSNHALGILLGLGAAVLYAAVIILNKLTPGISGIHRTLIQFISAIAVLLPYTALSGGYRLAALDAGAWALLMTVGIFHTGITYCWYFSALRQLKGREIGLFSFLDPLIAVLLSALALREALSPLQALGGAMILFFTWLSEKRAKALIAPEHMKTAPNPG